MAGGWSAVSSMSSWMRSSVSGICPARGASVSASVTDRSHPRRLLPSTDPITTTDYDANGSTRPLVRQLPIRMHRPRMDQGMNPDRGRRRKNQQRASSPTPRRPPRTHRDARAFHPFPFPHVPGPRGRVRVCGRSREVGSRSVDTPGSRESRKFGKLGKVDGRPIADRRWTFDRDPHGVCWVRVFTASW